MPPVSDPRQLTIKQAVVETQASESTIKRRLRAGAFPHAGQDTDGLWLIPVTDLTAVGLRPGKRAKPDPLPTQLTQMENLHVENAELRTRLAVAEALAGERERIIGVQERMLRMLEAGRPAVVVAEPPPEPLTVEKVVTQPPAPPMRSGQGWWRRWSRATN
jgi:hypothetical protein